MKSKKKIIFLSFVVIVGCLLFWVQSISDRANERIMDNDFEKVVINNNVFFVAVSETEEKRAVGLSDHTFLEKDEGMLFVFENPGIYPFWMKDMSFAIDILWIDQNKKIIHIVSEIAPETFPETFVSQEKALYVLEIVEGEVKRKNIRIGDVIIFQDQ